MPTVCRRAVHVPLGGKCGGNLGTLTSSGYYYATDFAIYRHTPDSKALVMLLPRKSYYRVDDYGIYYTSGKTLYVRRHDTGKTEALYKSGQKLGRVSPIRALEDGIVTL